ncbi:LPS export ABC transporter permease LptF [Moraxella lincolnii]|nr:LPS export ABC transporter permease LptF [Moraxella lincolnii]
MILRRYMIYQLSLNTAVVLGFLVVLLLGGRLIRYFGLAAEGRLDVGLLFTIIGYNLPFFLELILPLAFFIALMLVFGRLWVDHEMAVINASGISRGRLGRMATPLILLLFVIEATLSLFGKPWGVRHSESIWQEQALKSAFELIRPGEFISSGDYHLYVGSVSPDKKQLQDVLLIQTQTTEPQDTQPPKPLTSQDTLILAKTAKQVLTDSTESQVRAKSMGKTQLDLFNGRRYEISADSLKYNQVGFARYRLTLTQPVQDVVNDDNKETQPLSQIWQASRQPTVDNAPNIAAQAELGYRLALPWLMLLAPMFAIPLAQVRPRQGRWLRLIPAILLFVSVALLLISLKKPISDGKVGVWAYGALLVVLFILALYLNWASRLNQRLRFGFYAQRQSPNQSPRLH